MITKVLFAISVFLAFLTTDSSAQVSKRAAVVFDGRELLNFQFPIHGLTPGPDLVWINFVEMAGQSPLLPTEHFNPSLGKTDNSGWVVITGGGDDSRVNGKLELKVGDSVRVWIKELKLKFVDSNNTGVEGWVLDSDSLKRVPKKTFIERDTVFLIQNSSAPGVTDISNADQRAKKVEVNRIQDYRVLLWDDGHKVAFEGRVKSELRDPDLLWRQCKKLVQQQEVRFVESDAATSFKTGSQDASNRKLDFGSQGQSGIRLYVDGLGVTEPIKVILSAQTGEPDASYRLVESVDWGDSNWLIRRKLVPRLENQGKIMAFHVLASADGKTLNFRIAEKGHGEVFNSAVFSFNEARGNLEKVYQFSGDRPHGPISAWGALLTDCGRYVIDIRPVVTSSIEKKANCVRVFDMEKDKSMSFSLGDFLSDKEIEQLNSKRWCDAAFVDQEGKVYFSLGEGVSRSELVVLELGTMNLERIDDSDPKRLVDLKNKAKTGVAKASWVCEAESLQTPKSFPLKLSRIAKSKSGNVVSTNFAFDTKLQKYVVIDAK